jgi:hypothetical protein
LFTAVWSLTVLLAKAITSAFFEIFNGELRCLDVEVAGRIGDGYRCRPG